MVVRPDLVWFQMRYSNTSLDVFFSGPWVENPNWVQRADTSQVDGVCIYSEMALICRLS